MTAGKSFKRLVRTRMEKTGESYTAARAVLLAGEEPRATRSPLATSDAEIRRRTGRGWEEWFDLLDAVGAPDRTHRDNARWVAQQQGVDPLAWNAQAVVGSYELARRLRQVGEKADGFSVTASKTVGVDVDDLFDAVVDPGRRITWLPDADLRERTATKPRSARFDWSDDGTRLHVTFAARGSGKAVVVVSHQRLPDAGAADRMRAYWRERVAVLKEGLER